MSICDNISVSKEGHLLFAGQDTVSLAKQYGTPLYLMDEDKIRESCRVYTASFKKHFGETSLPLYGSKANSFKRIYEIMSEEGMGIDVVSSGEMYTAILAGYDLSNAYFHSSNKTDADIVYGMDNHIGYFVADNVEEIKAIEAEAGRRGIVAAAGMTLYTCGTIKRIPGYKNYVSIDGGMPDNPRYALYKADYTCLVANKMNEEKNFEVSVVGRCCESGDIIQQGVMVTDTVGRGDTIAVCTTGAYNYSMASNYNRLPRPPIVMLHGGNESAAKKEKQKLNGNFRFSDWHPREDSNLRPAA